MLVKSIFLAIFGLFMLIIPNFTYKMAELPTSESTRKPIKSYIWGIRICGMLFVIVGIYVIILHIIGQPNNLLSAVKNIQRFQFE